jgi:hypothetical protein
LTVFLHLGVSEISGNFGREGRGSVVAACQELALGRDRTKEGAAPPQHANNGRVGDPGCAPPILAARLKPGPDTNLVAAIPGRRSLVRARDWCEGQEAKAALRAIPGLRIETWASLPVLPSCGGWESSGRRPPTSILRSSALDRRMGTRSLSCDKAEGFCSISSREGEWMGHPAQAKRCEGGVPFWFRRQY